MNRFLLIKDLRVLVLFANLGKKYFVPDSFLKNAEHLLNYP